jgi:hypothetical protein
VLVLTFLLARSFTWQAEPAAAPGARQALAA